METKKTSLENNLIEQEKTLFFQTYNRLPVVIEEARGNLIWDKSGVCYYDFLAGIAVNALGYSHPRILEAISKQSARYLHLSNYFYQDAQINFAKKLKDMSGYDRIFLSNSGTEANEGAIKLCRKWGSDKNKTEMIAFTGGFHGRTYGSLSLMDKPVYKENMGPWLDGMKIVKFNDCDELDKNVSEKTAGIMLEFIQGEGGLVEVTPEFIEKINELKGKYNFLVIADEIQTGAGRTGKFFGSQHYKIIPDIVTMAKGIGGGLPLGAILAKEFLNSVWSRGNHGTTYGGNALACATGLVVLEELEKGIIDTVQKLGVVFKSKLNDLQKRLPNKIKEIRGNGLMLGVVLTFEASLLVKEMLDKHKIITNATSGNVLRVIPPLIIKEDDINFFVEKLEESLLNLPK